MPVALPMLPFLKCHYAALSRCCAGSEQQHLQGLSWSLQQALVLGLLLQPRKAASAR